MRWRPQPGARTRTAWWGLLAICFLAGCAPPPPDAAPSDESHPHHKKAHHHSEGSHPTPHPHDAERSGEAPAAVAEKAQTVLKHINEHHEAPAGYEGGRTFHNGGGAGEQALPTHDDRGRAITYQEWDVNPKVDGINRGTERLVTGSDGSAYVTADHYRTFTKIR